MGILKIYSGFLKVYLVLREFDWDQIVIVDQNLDPQSRITLDSLKNEIPPDNKFNLTVHCRIKLL